METVDIAARLRGGDSRSLGRVEDVIEAVLDDPAQVDALFACLFFENAVVRMRAADGLEKIARQRPQLLVPYIERLLSEVATIEQPSVQWHLAQILAEVPLGPAQRRRAVEILRRNLEHADDWIVLNLTMEALARFAQDDPELRRWLASALRSHLADRRKAVVKRASKLLERLEAA